jgi:hypothetical protein
MRRLRYAHQRVQRRARQEEAQLLARVQQGIASLDPDEPLGLSGGEGGLAWFAARCRTRPGAVAPAAAAPPAGSRKRRAKRSDTTPA